MEGTLKGFWITPLESFYIGFLDLYQKAADRMPNCIL
jgi:hypothetical protein